MVAIVRSAKPLAGDDGNERDLLGVVGPETAAEGQEAAPEQENKAQVIEHPHRGSVRRTDGNGSMKISPEKFDELAEEVDAWRRDRLWGAALIASVAGVSEDTAKRWSEDSTCPIRKVGGRYFCRRSDLIRWMTKKDNAA
jgi:hypothetical protein